MHWTFLIVWRHFPLEVILSSEIERKKILIVDDELDMRIFLCNLLGNCGYESIDAGNRVEGLQKAKQEKPALIILDVMMPKEGGIRMYRDLKQDRDLKEVPVLMLSNIDRKTFLRYQRFHSTHRGWDVPDPGAYLEKPLEAEELIETVRMLTKKAECTVGLDG
jgi:two-component system phosphate regulon response regulator PhoB